MQVCLGKTEILKGDLPQLYGGIIHTDAAGSNFLQQFSCLLQIFHQLYPFTIIIKKEDSLPFDQTDLSSLIVQKQQVILKNSTELMAYPAKLMTGSSGCLAGVTSVASRITPGPS